MASKYSDLFSIIAKLAIGGCEVAAGECGFAIMKCKFALRGCGFRSGLERNRNEGVRLRSAGL